MIMVQMYFCCNIILFQYVMRFIFVPWAFFRTGSILTSFCDDISKPNTDSTVRTFGCWTYGVDYWPGRTGVVQVQEHESSAQSCYYVNVPVTHQLVNMFILLVMIVACHLVQHNFFMGKVWRRYPMLQRTSISLLHGAKQLLGVTCIFFGVVLLMIANMNSHAFNQSTHGNDRFINLPVSRTVGLLVISIMVSFLYSVVMPLIKPSGGHTKINLVTTGIQAAGIYFFMWLAQEMRFNGLGEGSSHHYIDDKTTLWAYVVMASSFAIVLAHPVQRSVAGALGFVQQYYLRRMFYAGQQDVPITSLNRLEWPVPPVFIANATQHDLLNAKTYTVGRNRLSFESFEITPEHWGSYLSGFWKTPTDLRLSTAMQMSGAATSGTIGAGMVMQNGVYEVHPPVIYM